MELKIGKRYVRRDGVVVSLETNPNPSYRDGYLFRAVGELNTYQADGRYHLNIKTHPLDIVHEEGESPQTLLTVDTCADAGVWSVENSHSRLVCRFFGPNARALALEYAEKSGCV